MEKIKLMRIVWAILVLSFLLSYSCASIPKAGVSFEKSEKMESISWGGY